MHQFFRARLAEARTAEEPLIRFSPFVSLWLCVILFRNEERKQVPHNTPSG